MHIQRIIETSHEVLKALDQKNRQLIEETAASLAQAVEDTWQAYQNGNIPTQVRGQALPLTMYYFATEELPLSIRDETQWASIAKEIKIFLRMVDIVATPQPTETESAKKSLINSSK